MVESVKALPKAIQNLLDVQIWNVKKLEGITKKKALGAKGVPSIAINSEVVFQSGIPQQQELIEAILDHQCKGL